MAAHHRRAAACEVFVPAGGRVPPADVGFRAAESAVDRSAASGRAERHGRDGGAAVLDRAGQRDAAGAVGRIGRDRARGAGSGHVGPGNGRTHRCTAGCGARLFCAECVGVQHVPVGIVSGVRTGGGERAAVREARMEQRHAVGRPRRVRTPAGGTVFFEPAIFDLSQLEFLVKQSGAGGVQAGDHAAAGIGRVPVDRVFQRWLELGAATGDHVAGGVLGARGAGLRMVARALEADTWRSGNVWPCRRCWCWRWSG